jgi:hypothetical protein
VLGDVEANVNECSTLLIGVSRLSPCTMKESLDIRMYEGSHVSPNGIFRTGAICAGCG